MITGLLFTIIFVGISVITSAAPDPRNFIRISEIMFSSDKTTDAETYQGWSKANFNWVELTNIGTLPVNLNGVGLGDSVEFIFTTGEYSY